MHKKHKRAQWVSKVEKSLAELKAKCNRGEPITQSDIDGIVVIFGGGGPGEPDDTGQ